MNGKTIDLLKTQDIDDIEMLAILPQPEVIKGLQECNTRNKVTFGQRILLTQALQIYGGRMQFTIARRTSL